MKNKKVEKWLYIFSILVFVFLLLQALFQTGISAFINFPFAADLGETLAGILSFISVLFIYHNLLRQTETFYLSQFENKYFEQIKFHRNNVQNLVYKSPKSLDNENPEIRRNHQVFISVFREILLAIKELDECFSQIELSDIYKNSKVQKERREKLSIGNRQIDMLALEKINIAFLIVFFGVAQEGLLVLQNRLGQIYNEELIKNILDKFTRISAKWSKNCQQKFESKKFVKYYGGHQHRLGHYFRNLYQTLKYIDDQKKIDYEKKYSYAKSLRAQLSTYEQGVIFFNSISDLGRVWELENEEENRQLITKYNFIKNIPPEFIMGINVDDYYPLIHFEGRPYPSKRDELEKHYD